MKILIVSSYFPPHVGGVEVVAQQQAAALADAGHTVVVGTSRTGETQAHRERREGYDIVRLPVSNLLERRTGVPYPLIGPAFWRGLAALVAWCDVVHVHDVLYQPPQLAALLARRAGKPMYVTQHAGRVRHHNPVVLAAARLSAAVARRFIWDGARRVVAHNALVADYLSAQGVAEDRVVRAPSGIDTVAFAPGAPGDGHRIRQRFGLPAGVPLVLFVGRLVRQKGYQELVAAADSAYHVVLAGTGQPERPLPAGVSFIGPVERADLIALYRLADVFVLPATGEIFPLAVQEAMACGLPVVTTYDHRYDAYDLDRELICLVQPRAEELRRAVLTVLADEELRRRMGEHSRRFAVEHFDRRINQAVVTRMYDEDLGMSEDRNEEHPCPSVSSS
ncbi:MAG TPA: glycosyltransferase family 4 protein [Actinoplanes sp.]|nr:glycosyltransferase family 4 protein [Actinoplanes sp.]